MAAICLLSALAAPAAEVTPHRLENAAAEPHNWLTYYGTYNARRYSALDQIGRGNVGKLAPVWAFETGVIDGGLQCSPLVADGVMYITSSWNRVFALDAAGGKEIWHYDHPRTEDIPGLYGTWNRGVSTGSRQPDWARAGLKQPGWKQTGSRLSPRAAATLLSLLSLAAVPSLAQTTIRLDDAALHAAMERRAGRRACARSTMISIK